MTKNTTNKARAIEWAEYVLPIYEKHYPEDNRPRKAVEAAKANEVSYAAAAAATTAYTASSAAHAAAYAYAASAASAAHAARARAHAAAYAAYAASAAASAPAAAYYAAAYAAQAILLERYGKDVVKVKKVLLLQDCIDFNSIKWLDYKPEQFWDVMLETYCENK